MWHFTKTLCLQVVPALAVVFLLVSFAQASGSHYSHQQVVSPFDKVSADKPLHCLLNAHLHQTKRDCPHKANSSNSAELRADCGSHSGATNSKGFSFGSDIFQFSQIEEFTHSIESHPFYFYMGFKVSLSPHSIEHPPQLS